MPQINQKLVTLTSIMRSAAFMKGYKEACKGKPYDYEIFQARGETKQRWDYERGRQFALVYGGNVKDGARITFAAQNAMNDALFNRWVR
jgi:hypothetical protein